MGQSGDDREMAKDNNKKASAKAKGLNGAVLPVMTGEGAFIVDASKRIRFWNGEAEQLTGVSTRDALGRHCESVLGQTPLCTCNHICPLSGWNADTAEPFYQPIDTPLGKRVVNVSTVLLGRGDSSFVLHLMRDVTEKRRMQRLGEHYLNDGKGNGKPTDIEKERQLINLTKRQKDVLDLLAEGLSVKRIAWKMCLTESTVRNHIRAIYQKMEVHSQVEAVAAARRLQLVN